MKKLFFIFMLIVGLAVFLYLTYTIENYNSELIEIKLEDNISMKVECAYNERGIYILNDSCFLNSATLVIGDFPFQIKDDAIWRPEGSKHYPRISDISAPFTISKNKNNDTVFIEKNGSNISLLLSH